MKTQVVTIAAILALAVCATAALAADFECTYFKAGDNYTYTLRNNHATIDVVQWSLRWYADDTANQAACLANFYTPSGANYITPFPNKWDRVDTSFSEPQWWTDDYPAGAPIMHGGNQLSFTVKYNSPSSPLPSLFKVGYMSGAMFTWSSDMNVIPEPGTIAILLTGLAGAGVMFRRKTR